MKRLYDRETAGPHRATDGSILFRVFLLDGWLKNAKAVRLVAAAVVLLATFLGACAKELWPAYRISEGIVFETEHSMAEFVELQKAHRNCQRPTKAGVWRPDIDEANRAAEDTQGEFCASVLIRTTAHPGGVSNAYQRWMRGKTRALSDGNAGEGVGDSDS